MKSTLKFDLNGSNDPIIVAGIHYDSDDLRDKVAERFFNPLWGSYTEPGNEQEFSSLCFVERNGTSAGRQDYQIIPIPVNEESKFINRLKPSQALRILPLAFQMFDGSDRRKILEQLTKIDSDILNKEKEVVG